MQRLTQMSVVPDLLPNINPVAEVELAFRRRTVQPGEFVDSRVSEGPARLRVQVFDPRPRLVSVVVVDPDVPDPEQDGFRSRCHYLAVNIPVSATMTSIPFTRLPATAQQLLSWLPPHAQKGSPYHRLAVFVLEQIDGRTIQLSDSTMPHRDGFQLGGFLARHRLRPLGAHLFRTQWDEGTAAVMARANLPGADVEFKRRRIGPMVEKQLPLKKKKNLRGLAGLPSKRLSFSRRRMTS